MAIYIPITTGEVTSLVTVENQLFSTAVAVSSEGVYTSPVFGTDNIYLLQGRLISEKAGTISLQVSDDGVTWDPIYTNGVTGADLVVVSDNPAGGVMRYVYTDTSDEVSTYFRFSVYALKVGLS